MSYALAEPDASCALLTPMPSGGVETIRFARRDGGERVTTRQRACILERSRRHSAHEGSVSPIDRPMIQFIEFATQGVLSIPATLLAIRELRNRRLCARCGTRLERKVSFGPGFDVGALPDAAASETADRLGEVGPVDVPLGRTRRDAERLRDLGQAGEFLRHRGGGYGVCRMPRKPR